MSAIIQDVPNPTGAFPVDPPTIIFPLAEEGNCARVFIQNFMGFSGYASVETMGAAGMFGGTYLAREGDRNPLAGGYVSFPRHYAEIPSGFNTYEGAVLTLPIMGNNRTWNDTNYRVVRVWNDFFLTNSPQSITLSGMQRFLGVDGYYPATLSTATDPTILTYSGWVNAGTEMISTDATISRYYGPIWRRQTSYIVPK